MVSARATQIIVKADESLAVLLARTDAAPHAELGDAYHRRRVADVLAHLHAWHFIFDGWVAQERAGSVPAFPAEGYTWDRLNELNDALYSAHRERTYDALRAMLVASHRVTVDLVATLDERELIDPEAFPWLAGQALGDVADDCLGNHYAWALGVLDAAGVA